MTHYQLEAGRTLVEALTKPHDPVGAVIELVWNSLDADAYSVVVNLLRNDADGVIGVSVEDDGHGISPADVRSYFKRVGDSWKRGSRVSQGEKRPLHGQAGQGRLRAFAIGNEVTWTTVADDVTGARRRSIVRARASSKDGFDCSEADASDEPTGTRFEAVGLDSLNRLDTDKAFERVTRELAPYLMAQSRVSVRYNGRHVNPNAEAERDVTLPLSWQTDEVTFEAALRVIEWRSGSSRSLLLCDQAGVPVDEPDLRLPAPDFPFTAYVLWADMPTHRNEWMITDLESHNTPLGGLIDVALNALEEHFDSRRDERRREQVEEWKRRKTYPYKGEPETEEEKVERAAFDVVATSIGRHIPSKNKQQEGLTLGLLRDSLKQRPANVSHLLDQFLGLPDDERHQLDRLLKRTGLSRVIRASTSVANRLEFIAALELMVYDPDANKLVGERDHLHKILENELWIFGEQFNQMISERGLSAVLERHLEILGVVRTSTAGVRKLDGTSGRLDLLLSAAATEHDRNRHLVVELKAPKVTATEKELSQIKAYAKAIVADARFANSATIWDFWLVVTDIDEDVRQEAAQRDRPRGLVFEPDLPSAPETKVRVWVRTWSEIIEDCRRRLALFQERLQHDPSIDEAREYLSRVHGDVIPEGLFSDPEGATEELAGESPAHRGADAGADPGRS
ncbi:histidine kinase [Nostocoides sp. F2B08]|uniref:ATP-binding protein n=1 Tax=Nostocoides sp. F2B08 TaxID=2653936 RepID=UPI0012637186|nr:ATP-binding protein [Tetrasphaera sp. F2B08]KAB7744156.1 histidine kinase [Tetrasphaera sp. F2B08]